MVFLVRGDLRMGKGKTAAQVAHAAVELYKKALREQPEALEEWERGGAKKVVLRVGSESELLEYFRRYSGDFCAVIVRDAGHTQVPPGSVTVAGFGPDDEKKLDRAFGHLKLL